MLKRTLLSILTVLLFHSSALPQESSETKTPSTKSSDRVYFEALGNGLIYSLNFEHQTPKSFGSMGYRIGAGYTDTDDLKLFAVPVGVNFLFGKSNRYFETGVGVTYLNRTEESYTFYSDYRVESEKFNEVSLVFTFGYRSEPKAIPGFSFRAGFSPTYYQEQFVPYFPYLSLGYKFN